MELYRHYALKTAAIHAYNIDKRPLVLLVGDCVMVTCVDVAGYNTRVYFIVTYVTRPFQLTNAGSVDDHGYLDICNYEYGKCPDEKLMEYFEFL